MTEAQKLCHYRSQRAWRQKIINRLKAKLGLWCRRCESADAIHMSERDPGYLELVIPNRRASDLSRYGNNTVTIYNHILRGRLPLDRVTLLCSDCAYFYKQEAKEYGSGDHERVGDSGDVNGRSSRGGGLGDFHRELRTA